jgi:hypothetical protein
LDETSQLRKALELVEEGHQEVTFPLRNRNKWISEATFFLI